MRITHQPRLLCHSLNVCTEARQIAVSRHKLGRTWIPKWIQCGLDKLWYRAISALPEKIHVLGNLQRRAVFLSCPLLDDTHHQVILTGSLLCGSALGPILVSSSHFSKRGPVVHLFSMLHICEQVDNASICAEHFDFTSWQLIERCCSRGHYWLTWSCAV